MRTIRTSLAIIGITVLGVAVPASAHAATSVGKTPIQYGYHWGS